MTSPTPILWVRHATPKPPKRRSRAGCNYCKDKKKKCDEARPRCTRCREHGQDCVYEPVKPRQRRRHQTVNGANRNTRQPHHRGVNQVFQFTEGWEMAMWHMPTGEYESGPFPSPAASIYTGDISVLHANLMTHDYSSDATDSASSQEEIEEVLRQDSIALSPSCGSPYLVPVTTVPPVSLNYEYCAPAFVEFSERHNRRALVDHFANVLSHLIVLREDEGNPFQQLVLPLSRKSKAVENAIYALTCAHLERRGVRNEESSVVFHNLALQGVNGLIEQRSHTNRNEILAAIILLVYYEVALVTDTRAQLVQRSQFNIVHSHLKGAMAIMNQGGTLTDPTGAFLERAFRFYDVIAALSFGTAPIYNGGFAPLPPINCRGATVAAGNADALLGMATSLWPIIHHLSTLGGLKRDLSHAEMQGNEPRACDLRKTIADIVSAVEPALQGWTLDTSFDEALLNDTGDLSTEKATERKRLQSIHNSAEAYRHSGIVYLYRTIYACPRAHAVVQRHTHTSLIHCVGTVKSGGPMGALLWPLFVAACEAIDQADRDLAQQAFAGVLQRQGMTNIHRAWLIVQEVWNRVDNGEDAADESLFASDLWRRVSNDMDFTVVFG